MRSRKTKVQGFSRVGAQHSSAYKGIANAAFKKKESVFSELRTKTDALEVHGNIVRIDSS